MGKDPYATLTLTENGSASPFHGRAPKQEGLSVVKLAEKNLREVGAYILKAIGGSVKVVTDESPRPYISIGGLGKALYQGDWVVEEYDYVNGVNTYRRAELEERIRYDLR